VERRFSILGRVASRGFAVVVVIVFLCDGAQQRRGDAVCSFSWPLELTKR
jgi:hypothetical protein